MALLLEVATSAGHSSFFLTPFENRSMGGKRQLALDAQGRSCRTALRTWDGVNVLPGAVADGYEDADGNTVPCGELVATDALGRPLRQLPATAGRVQRLEGPVPIDDLLTHIVTKVYRATPHYLDPSLAQSIAQGDIYRVAFRPRSTTSNPPAFLLANNSSVFLLQTAPCRLEWLTREQQISVDLSADEEEDTPAWGDWLGDYTEDIAL